jgi:hypothetical protein
MKRYRIKPYIDVATTWPDRGKVILAQYDSDSIIIYQAVDNSTADVVISHQNLNIPGISFRQMAWFQTSFFGLMHHSRWGTAPAQSAVLAIWIQRKAFDNILKKATPAQFSEAVYKDKSTWQADLENANVRLQWNPDFPPQGPKLHRKAVHLGLRKDIYKRLAQEWIICIEDISQFVRQQRQFTTSPDMLFTPDQRIYPVDDPSLANRLGLDKRAST